MRILFTFFAFVIVCSGCRNVVPQSGLPSFEFPEGPKGNEWPLTLRHSKIVKEMSWHGYLEGKQLIFQDGSKVECGPTPDGLRGYEIYQRGGYDDTRSAVPRRFGGSEIVGIRIQYFPDCQDDRQGFTGEHPLMVIYVYGDGRAHRLGFSPTGKHENDTWFENANDILLFHTWDDPQLSHMETSSTRCPNQMPENIGTNAPNSQH